MAQGGSVKRFAERPATKVLIGVIALVTLLGSFVYLETLLAIATFLFFGLAIPIYLGWKNVRQLALMGLVVLLLAAPIATVPYTQTYRTASPVASSSTSLPYGNGGAVLQNAMVTPFTGPQGGIYNFSVDIHPNFVPSGTGGLHWIELFVSTCPGANSTSSTLCGSGYAFKSANLTLPSNATQPYTVRFDEQLNISNIWWFQFATGYYTNNGTTLTWILLDPANGYPAVEGPVSGSFLSTYELLLEPIYELFFLYVGIVFFVALGIYWAFKRRESRRKAQDAEMAGPTGSAPADPSGGGSSTSPPAATSERRCVKCNAVLYPNETSCWKCGTPVAPAVPAADAPLQGGKS